MSELIPIITEKVISIDGYFDLKQTYSDLMTLIEDSLGYDTNVKDYNEANQDGKKEITSIVEGERLYNEVYKIVLKFKFQAKGKDSTIELNGKKIKLIKGNGRLSLNCFLDPDWDNQRQSGPLAKFLQQLYNRYIGNDEQKKIEESAVNDTKLIEAKFKTHFDATIK